MGDLPLVEFAVNFNDEKDVQKIDECLQKKGVKMVSSNVARQSIKVSLMRLIESGERTDLSACDVQSIQRFIEDETGFLAVIKGLGQLESAVVELRAPPRQPQTAGAEMFGVVRMTQMADNACFIDGLINGQQIKPKLCNIQQTAGRLRLQLAVHNYGDLSSDNYDSIGDVNVSILEQDQLNESSVAQSLPNISVQKILPNCRVFELIGKSVALSLVWLPEASDNCNKCEIQFIKREILSAGVIARSSIIESNKKQVCTCSGKTLWQEREERLNSK